MSHSFCGECGRVLYSLYQYGPISVADRNRVYCVCDGEIDPQVFFDFMRYTPNKTEFKELLRESESSEADE